MSSTENRRHKACNACRERKVRCDGGAPKCGRCTKSSLQCFYAPSAGKGNRSDFMAALQSLNYKIVQEQSSAGHPLLPKLSFDMTDPIWPGAGHVPLSSQSETQTSYVNSDFRIGCASNMPMPTQEFTAEYTRGGEFEFNLGGSVGYMMDEDRNARDDSAGRPRSIRSTPRTEFLSKEEFNKAMNAQVGYQEFSERRNVDVSGNISPEFSGDNASSESTQRSSTYSSQYKNNDQAMVSNFFDSVNHSTATTPPFAPLKRGRLENSQRHSNENSNNNALAEKQFEQEQGASRPSTGLQPSLSSVSSDESVILAPCGTRNRRRIGNGAAFNAIAPLRGTGNYPEWARAMRAAARKEGVWATISGSCKKPMLKELATPAERLQYQEDVSYWASMNDLALGGLEGSLEKDIQLSVDNMVCSRSMWLKLERDYKATDNRILYGLVEKLNVLDDGPDT